MVLQDPATGRRLFVTFFDSREAIDAAEQRFEAMGDEIPEDIRGRRTSVDTYEVVWSRTPGDANVRPAGRSLTTARLQRRSRIMPCKGTVSLRCAPIPGVRRRVALAESNFGHTEGGSP